MPLSKLRPSFTLTEDRLRELQAVVPEAFADGRINWDTLREALGETLEDESQEHFGLFWPGKREARRLAAMPSKGTLIPQPGADVDEGNTHNLFIEGDNLEVLKLLQKSYAGRVKMIYIDPPYNTGNDFVYPDDYSEPLDAYLQRTGQVNEAGQLLTTNSRASGRFHSNWLNMIYPRLLLAKRLLSDEGIIFVSIDDNEVHNLRSVMNEVFGEENFLACFIWHRRQMADSRNQNRASTDHEYVLGYSMLEAKLRGEDIDLEKYTNPDNDPRGVWFSADITGLANKEQRPNLHYTVVNPKTGFAYPPSPTRGWSVSKETFNQLIADGKILWPSSRDGRPRRKKFLSEVTNFQTGFSTMLDVGFTTEGTKEIQNLFGEKIIQFPKPVSLIKTLVKQSTTANDIVLDFFAGSGTTAQAIFEADVEENIQRRFILVQLPEPTENSKYSTIAEIGKERIRRVIKQLKKEEKGKLKGLGGIGEIGFKCLLLESSHFKEWQLLEEKDVSQLELRFEKAETPLVEGWQPENLLAEILLLQGFPLDSHVRSLPEFKGNDIQQVTSEFVTHPLYVCLDKKIKPETVSRLKLGSEDIFVCLDSALSDEAKVKLADQCNLKVI